MNDRENRLRAERFERPGERASAYGVSKAGGLA